MATFHKVKNYKGFVIARQLGHNDAFSVFLPQYWRFHPRAALVPLFFGPSVKECQQYIDDLVVQAYAQI